ncbi:unnamed protein product [Prunus armeniaca]|uniref:Uncharacterized protein n=1 Tax=Prunus armeniaca TaxID=36596 RepID=A0A6J5URW3_PRUAR|nr:unnamed protein product [Prunus armeniaca]CAB4309742.1 unnamed protein product [Prunus armeniaca]
MEKTECSEAENFGFATTSLEPQATAKRKKNKSKNQRRFSDEQIRYGMAPNGITILELVSCQTITG